jgi:hypothetical protein
MWLEMVAFWQFSTSLAILLEPIWEYCRSGYTVNRDAIFCDDLAVSDEMARNRHRIAEVTKTGLEYQHWWEISQVRCGEQADPNQQQHSLCRYWIEVK